MATICFCIPGPYSHLDAQLYVSLFHSGSVTIIEQPNPIYEVPVPSHNKQDRGGISEDDNALRYSNRMSLNVSYNTQSQIKQELQQQIPPAGKEREGGEGDGGGGGSGDGGRDGQDMDSNDEDDYEEYMN